MDEEFQLSPQSHFLQPMKNALQNLTVYIAMEAQNKLKKRIHVVNRSSLQVIQVSLDISITFQIIAFHHVKMQLRQVISKVKNRCANLQQNVFSLVQ